LSARSASTESRSDSKKLRRDNGKLRLSVARSAQGQELTKCREIRTVKRKECVERFLLKKSLSLNFVKDSKFARSASESSSGEIATKNQQKGRDLLKVVGEHFSDCGDRALDKE
jgi:hypothetical protein